MKPEIIKTQIEELTQSCIDSVEDHFSLFVIEEFKDDGYWDLIIDDTVRYKYWLQQGFKIKELIVDLQSTSNQDLLVEVIKLKSVKIYSTGRKLELQSSNNQQPTYENFFVNFLQIN